MISNYLCIIDGNYKIYKTRADVANGEASGEDDGGQKMLDLVEFYRQSLTQAGSEETFNEVNSKDGSELFEHMLQAFGVASGAGGQTTLSSDMADKALSEFSTVMSSSGLFERVSHYTVNSSLAETPSYIAFVVADFDPDHDRAFARLEDAQFKLTNLSTLAASSGAALATVSFNSLHFTHTLAASASGAHPQKRFLIIGWPVLYYCIKNELVSF